MKLFKVLQWNVEKSVDNAMAPMLRDPRIGQYAVIAIQEPWRNPYYVTSHFPKETKDLFHLAMPETEVSEEWPRVCTYVSRDLKEIEMVYNTRDIITLHVRPKKDGPRIFIHNVYIAPGGNSQIEKEGTDMLIASLAATEAYDGEKEHIIVGDFNMVDPLWAKGVRTNTRTSQLREIIDTFPLYLATPMEHDNSASRCYHTRKRVHN